MDIKIGLYGQNQWNLREMELLLQIYADIRREGISVERFSDRDMLERHLQRRAVQILFVDGELEKCDMPEWVKSQERKGILCCFVDYWKDKTGGRKPPFRLFLEKPLQTIPFLQMVGKLEEEYQRQKQGTSSRLIIKHRYKDLSIPCDDIVCITKTHEEFIVHTWHCEAYNSYGALKGLMDRLPKDSFFRASRGCIVNLRHVTLIESDRVTVQYMSKVEVLPLCRKMMREIHKAKRHYDAAKSCIYRQ